MEKLAYADVLGPDSYHSIVAKLWKRPSHSALLPSLESCFGIHRRAKVIPEAVNHLDCFLLALLLSPSSFPKAYPISYQL